MTDTLCNCGRPITDNALVCRSCGDALRQDLGEVADGALAQELETALARQARMGGTGARSAEAPLGYGEAAATAIWILRTTMVAWILLLSEDSDYLPPGVLDEQLPALAWWLRASVEDIRRHPDAAAAIDELTAAVRQARNVVYGPTHRVYCGQCGADASDGPCPVDLYAHPDAGVVQCPCGAVWDVQRRRDWLLVQAEKMLGTATEIARAVTGLGREVTPERIWQWASRGRLLARGRGPRGQPLYRVGDVLDLLDAAVAAPIGPACRRCDHRTCRLIRTRHPRKAA